MPERSGTQASNFPENGMSWWCPSGVCPSIPLSKKFLEIQAIDLLDQASFYFCLEGVEFCFAGQPCQRGSEGIVVNKLRRQGLHCMPACGWDKEDSQMKRPAGAVLTMVPGPRR